MIYKEYQINKIEYDKLTSKLFELMTEKEKKFLKTLPKGISYEKDRIDASAVGSTFDNYVMSTEKLDDSIKELKQLISERKEILDALEKQLQKSNNTFDRIYYLRNIRNAKVSDVALYLSYSESQIYRLMQQMRIS